MTGGHSPKTIQGSFQSKHTRVSRHHMPHAADAEVVKSQCPQQPLHPRRDPGQNAACTGDESGPARAGRVATLGTGTMAFSVCARSWPPPAAPRRCSTRASRLPDLSRGRRKPGATRPRDSQQHDTGSCRQSSKMALRAHSWQRCLHDARAREQIAAPCGEVTLCHSQPEAKEMTHLGRPDLSR